MGLTKYDSSSMTCSVFNVKSCMSVLRNVIHKFTRDATCVFTDMEMEPNFKVQILTQYKYTLILYYKRNPNAK